MNFSVKLENFNGPIDALLQLIEKRKMSISDVALVEITDDYINFVQSLKPDSLSNMTYFIFIASTLTLIKSKSLLPNLDINKEEEADIEGLKRRIEIFKLFKEISRSLYGNFSSKKKFYYAEPAKKEIIFTPSKKLSRKNISEAMSSIFLDFPIKDNKSKEASVRIEVHIDDMMKSLQERIENLLKINFSSFIDTQTESQINLKDKKVYNVVGFLAMLELVKNGVMNVKQENNFETILLESSGIKELKN